jgi:hypothetical protein
VPGPAIGNGLTGDNVAYRLGDVGAVIANSLDVFGAKKEMRCIGDGLRVFHHVSEKLPEQGIIPKTAIES